MTWLLVLEGKRRKVIDSPSYIEAYIEETFAEEIERYEGRNWAFRERADALFALCRQPFSSLEMIQRALSIHPLAYRLRDRDNSLPLHAVCGSHTSGVGSLEIIKYLVELYPESVNVSLRHSLPLHFAIGAKAPLDVIQYLLEQSPESIKARGGFRRYTPLQMACANGASLEVVQYLVEKWPESIKLTYESHRSAYPLHLACKNAAPLGVIPYLVKQWPEAVKIPTKHGRLPLHKACMATSPLPLAEIQFLVQQWPESVRIQENKNRATPLHCACGSVTSVGVIPYLVKQWPEACKISDGYGWIPLHNAFNGTVSYGSTRGYPSASEARTSLEDIQHLVGQCPESAEYTYWVMRQPTDPEIATSEWYGGIGGNYIPPWTPFNVADSRIPSDDVLANWLKLPWRKR